MNANDTVCWENRLAEKLRVAEDCLRRALDQMENIEVKEARASGYVKRQIDLAHDAVIDAVGAAYALHSHNSNFRLTC